ncbi:DUF4271 domain-containing protein [Prevotella sp. oral taxon 376]|uniref:DUF4271 domain-containing protein n=1 Tax=Prevotella sp. oral taxon 376 TaxID=712466 RepID=UPI000D1ED8E0|nr:DUF4271 domain-containing protein [Prevotella sp. oral taxon 376]PTL33833.1 DUF4271 domain-containing protein [Prevotella sp. oral taxon 376]
MIQQADSTTLGHTGEAGLGKEVPRPVKHRRQPTPREVVGWLPENATPAQMDSAIQLHVKPSEIHWSQMPDTLHLPGHPRSKSVRDIGLPTYYKESFFMKDSLFHPELPGGRLGVSGDPIPYAIANDNFFASLLIGCFVLALVAFSQSRKFISRQAKNFFFVPHEHVTQIPETANEIRFQVFLVLQTYLLLALFFFFYSNAYVGEAFMLAPYPVIAIYTGIGFAYFLLKVFLYWFTGWVFFDRRNNVQWLKSFLFIVSMEGVALFPIVVLQAFFGVSMQTTVVYAIVLLVFVKMLTFYKTYIIFFRKKSSFLQNILYFCALEIIPMLALWGVVITINSYLKINF